MHRWIRSLFTYLVGGLFLLGCRAVRGTKGSAGSGAQPVAQQAAPAVKAKPPPQGAGQPDPGEAQVTTPARSIDTKQLTDVVKEEVKGGESSEGPTPFDHLWQPSKAELIKDEPLAVTVPLGLQPLTPKIYVPASNPITKGKYELGRQLYFDPRVSLDATVSCATCHNPAKGLDRRHGRVDRDRRPDGQPKRTQRPQHGLWQDHVLGWPRSVARRAGPGAGAEPDRDGQAVVQGNRGPSSQDSRLRRSNFRKSSAPT